MPALLPIADNVAKTLGANYIEMMSAIVATSFAAAISPLSTGGAIIISSYSTSKETTTEEMNNMFKPLFLLSVANFLINQCINVMARSLQSRSSVLLNVTPLIYRKIPSSRE